MQKEISQIFLNKHKITESENLVEESFKNSKSSSVVSSHYSPSS